MIYLGTIANSGNDVRNNVNGAAVKASFDLGLLAAHNLDTVVRAKTAGTGGNAITVAAVGDNGLGDGVTIVELGSAVTIHFEDGVSTVDDVETAIAADSTKIEIATAGTGATVLEAATDEFTPTTLLGGAAATTPFTIPNGVKKIRIVPDCATILAAFSTVDAAFAPAATAMFPLGAAGSINDVDVDGGRTLALRKTDAGSASTKIFGV